jgi:hypothetical protein
MWITPVDMCIKDTLPGETSLIKMAHNIGIINFQGYYVSRET